MSKYPIVCDTTVLLYLGRIARDAVIAQGFHLSSELYQDVLKLAGEIS